LEIEILKDGAFCAFNVGRAIVDALEIERIQEIAR
jgi:hypothetical protein